MNIIKNIILSNLCVFSFFAMPVSCTKKQPEQIYIPKINVLCNLDNVGDEKQKIKIEYENNEANQFFATDATIKIQGRGSRDWDKKNYNIEFYENGTDFDKKFKIQLKNGWDTLSKYTFKSNYYEALYTRNNAASNIYGDVIHSRGDKDSLYDLVNGGAIDGFPVSFYNNNEFYGLYILNLAKDKTLFRMTDKSKKQAILQGENDHESPLFKELLPNDLSGCEDWTLEYCSDGEDKPEEYGWVVNSFNNLISFTNNSGDDDFKNQISNFIDLQRTIDYIIYINLCDMYDNVGNNVLWITLDGNKWLPSAYDLDMTFGYDPYKLPVFHDFNRDINSNRNLLFNRITNCCHDQLIKQYKELRLGALSTKNIITRFEDFYKSIPQEIIKLDQTKWPNIKDINTNTMDWLKDFITKRCNFFDSIWK